MLNVIKLTTSLFYLFLNTSCVSIGIESPKTVKSDAVTYQNPENYTPFEQQPLDAAWKNMQNGNTISYLSECNSATDPSYETIRDGIISGLSEPKILNQEMKNFNNRLALNSTVKGSVDGVATQLQIVILKKNNCIFVVTYVGLDKYFEQDLIVFQRFLEGFTVK